MSFSLPQPFLDRLDEQFGPLVARKVVMGLVARPVTLRVNTLKSTDADVMEMFRKELMQFERVKGLDHAFIVKNRGAKELLKHRMCLEGLVYLQGLTSQLPPLVLDPKAGEVIGDFCAAPGSKTSQIAAMIRKSGPPPSQGGVRGGLYAFEPNFIRIEKLHNTLKIQDAEFVETQMIDSTKLGAKMPEFFDKILLDVPCSGEGRIDAADDSSFVDWGDATMLAYPDLQKKLFASAVAALKVGGTLVYSTCTLAPDENENIITWALREFPSLVAETVMLPVTMKTASIVHKTTKSITLLPTAQWEGFFVAKLRKISRS